MRPFLRHTMSSACFLLMAWGVGVTPLHAELFDSALDRLPVNERVALREGEVTVSVSEEGLYTARVLVETSAAQVWEVLTDYEGSVSYAPNLISSTVLETSGDRTIVEQVSERQILFFTFRSRIRTENIASNERRIDFRAIEGDFPVLEGSWQLEPIAPFSGAEPTAVLIEQQVTAVPPDGVPGDIFRDAFQNSLAELMQALKGEIERRASISASSPSR
ncbi:MAG: cyclase/dehydrase [Oscillatoriales cyanobacterium]|nr:MAG: cyclase/dehydrase [Oscillatoriales cyanobacterium]